MDNQFDFGKTLNELEEILNKMEVPETSIDESLKMYENATKLIKQVEDALEEAKQKVEKVIEQ